jgi:O-antigen ligase
MKEGFRFFRLAPSIERRMFLGISYCVAFSIPFKASFNSLFCILLFVFWLFFTVKNFGKMRLLIIGLTSVLFWLALLGMLYTANVEEGLFRFQQKTLLLLLPLVFGTIQLTEAEVGKIATVFVLGVLAACIICLLTASLHWVQFGSSEHFFSLYLVDDVIVDLYPYILALLCLASMVLLSESFLGKLQLDPFFKKPFIGISLIVFFTTFILLLSVKQLIVALILGVLLYAIRINRAHSFVLLTCAILMIASSIFIMPTLRVRVEEALSEQNKENPLDQNPAGASPLNGVALRRALWICVLDVIKENPWIGVGSGDGQDELQKAYANREFVLAADYNRYNAHNQYLQVAVNFGIIGLSIWACSFVALGAIFKKNWLFLTLMSLVLFSMLTESLLETNKGALTLSFLLTLFSFSEIDNKQTGFGEPANK